MSERKGFLLYQDMKAVIDMLSDAQAGQLFKLIFEYRETEEQPDISDNMVKLVFTMIKSKLDDNDRKYAETVEKRRIAGQKGGLAKAQGLANVANATDAKQMVANATFAKQNKQELANVADTYTYTDTYTDIKEKPSKEGKKKFVPPTVEEVKSYCKEKGYHSVDAQRFVDFYESKNWMIGKNKMCNWRSAVSGWNARNRDAPNSADKAHNFPERDTDYEAAILQRIREGGQT